MSELSRRKIIVATTLLGSCASTASRFAWPAGPDERFDFTKLLDGWEIISGAWGIEEVAGAARDGRALVQRATNNKFNVRLYYYDGRRYMLASPSIMAPMLGEWHTLRVSANGDNLRGWLNSRPLINHRDGRFTAGRIGLWTKADSITAFDSLAITPKDAG